MSALVQNAEEEAANDWVAVAEEVITYQRLRKLGHRELARLAGISSSTLTDILHNPDRTSHYSHTLTSLSLALDLHRDHLAAIAAHEKPPDPPGHIDDSLKNLEHRLDIIDDKIDNVDRKVTNLTIRFDIVHPDLRLNPPRPT